MEYRRLGASGLKVAVLSLGTMMFGEKVSAQEAARIVHAALDAGVNLIDTADIYAGGESERSIGAALAGRRQRAVLATKVYMPTGPGPNDSGLSRYHIMWSVEQSLRRLQTDHIDLYQVHRFDPEVPLEETLGALTDLVRQGKVRYIGCSNWAAWQLTRALWVADRHRLARLDCVQPRYNIIVRDAERELLPACRDLGVGVIVYSPLAGGVLTGKYTGGAAPPGSRGFNNPAWQQRRLTPSALAVGEAVVRYAQVVGRPAEQVALNWVLAQPGVSSAILGVSTPAQLEHGLAALTWRMTPDAAEQLRTAAIRAEAGSG